MPAEPPTIRAATIPGELELVRELFREYATGLGVDLCFQGFAAELAGLPGNYSPPRGRLLLATRPGEVLGCVALRPLSDESGEMKRLYIRPQARGAGAGHLLIQTVIAEARAIGYQRLVLDTLPTMTVAARLYESFGFRDIASYCPNPVPGARFLSLELRAA